MLLLLNWNQSFQQHVTHITECSTHIKATVWYLGKNTEWILCQELRKKFDVIAIWEIWHLS